MHSPPPIGISGVAPWQSATPAANPRTSPTLLLRLWRWLPCALLTAVSAGSYACVMTLVLLPTVDVWAPLGDAGALADVSALGGWCVIAGYHALCLLGVIAFVTTSRMAPGHIPLWLYSREPGDQAYFHNVLQAVEKKLDGSLRFCRKCGAFKPDLAHHSREMGLCILCYQHWCLWANNAIGFYNYKAYLLALLYSGLKDALQVMLLLPPVLAAWPYGRDYRLALVSLVEGGDGSVLTFALVSLLASTLLGTGALLWLGFHGYLVCRGLTAHAYFRQSGLARHKPPKPTLQGRPFDFGCGGNLGRVCGRHPLLWLLPTNQGVEGNGIFFELAGGAADSGGWSRYAGK